MSVTYAVPAAILVVLLPFLWTLLRKWQTQDRLRSKPSADDGTAREGVDAGPTDSTTTANTNIAADFQLATVYPNIAFAAIGAFLAPVLNALSFGLGSLFVSWFAKRNPELSNADVTLHSFVGQLHRSRWLHLFAAVVSLFTFTAIITFEITFGARFLSLLLGSGAVTYYFLITLFVIYLGWFAFIGGQRVAFSANQTLLTIAYAGIHSSIAVLAFSGSVNIIGHPIGIAVFLLLIYSVYVRGKE